MNGLLSLWLKCGRILTITCSMLITGCALLVAQSHLLLSEITLQPAEAEFIEIFNPTNATILLDTYYLADNQVYPYVSKGSLPALDLGDFIVRFPPGASVRSNETVIVATNGRDFETYWSRKADFEIVNGDGNTVDMLVIRENTATLTNAGEGIALFYWNGSDATVKDVDLMNAGVPNATSQIVNKTGIAGYLPDAHTLPVQGHNGPPLNGFSTKRILPEGQFEIQSGGNGITGNDETSEDITKTWDEEYTEPTPGSTVLVADGTGPVSTLANAITVYPNPASSEVTLNPLVQGGIYTIRLVNSGGMTVRALTNDSPDSESIAISLSGLADGVYFVVFQSGGEIFTKKILLVKISQVGFGH